MGDWYNGSTPLLHSEDIGSTPLSPTIFNSIIILLYRP